MKNRKFILIVSILTTLLLIVGGIQAQKSIQKTTPKGTSQNAYISMQFSSPVLQEQNGNTAVLLNEATGYRNIPGEPIVPQIIKTIELPFRSQIDNIHCSFSVTADIPLMQKITPASKPVVYVTEKQIVQPSEYP